MKKEEKRLIEIIRDVLAGKNKSEWSMQISKEEIERVIKCARVHGVLPFLQTFKGEPIRIINDDKPAVCLQNGVFYACGTPFSGKTDKNENRKAPIQGLCMLHRGKTNKIQKITSGEALPLILPQTLFYGDEEETNLLLSFLDRFLQSVPVYKMECTMEEEAAKTAYFCMKGEEK